MRRRANETAAWLVAALATTVTVNAQGPLVGRQERAETTFRELQTRMQAMQAALATTEPQQVERLAAANRLVQERRTQETMERGRALLTAGRLDEAIATLTVVKGDLDALAALLSATAPAAAEPSAVAGRLGQWKEQVEDLREAQARLRSEAFDAAQRGDTAAMTRLAQQQTELEQRTAAVATAMEQDEDGKPIEDPLKRAPGSGDVRQAVERQREAAKDLASGDAATAQREQQEAEDALERALERLDESLAATRAQAQDAMAKELARRLEAMATAQKDLSARTLVADRLVADVRRTASELPDALVRRLAELAAGEAALVSACAELIALVVEDGSTAILQELLQRIGDDLERVRGRLAAADPGPTTQKLQRDVEAQLAAMLAALAEGDAKRAERRQQGQQKDGAQLVPPSTEIKLLQQLQLRVAERTKLLDAAPPAERPAADVDDVATQQADVAALMRKLAVKVAAAAKAASEGGK
jgi:hypothetical protein